MAIINQKIIQKEAEKGFGGYVNMDTNIIKKYMQDALKIVVVQNVLVHMAKKLFLNV
jgi:hypothetical protein